MKNESPAKQWKSRRNEHHFYAEIVADIKTRNWNCEDMSFDNMINMNLTKTCGTRRVNMY